MSVSTAVLLLFSTLLAQTPAPPPPPPPRAPAQPPAMTRDVVPRPEPTGTGVIRGRVVAGDTGTPIRRANVNLMPVAPPAPPPGSTGAGPQGTVTMTGTMVSGSGGTVQFVGPGPVRGRVRSIPTDSQGGFEFTGLPAGFYRLQASSGQYSAGYLSIAYGAKRPTGPGSMDQGATIELAEGQRFDKVTIALPRGAVITGRVTDENGAPLARVQVYTLFYANGSTTGQRGGSFAQTDDLGQFRLFGLNTGEYAVVAEAREQTFVSPNAPQEPQDDNIGFLTTYYPGTPDEAAAQRVRTRLGAETPGVELRLLSGRLYRLTGFVSDSQGRAATRANGQLMKRSGNMSTGYGFSTDDQGRFQMRNLAPGAYRIVVRGRPIPGMEGTQGEAVEMGYASVTINSDLEGVVVALSPGATITGQVVFEQGPPQMPASLQSVQMRIMGVQEPSNSGLKSPAAAVVSQDLTFTMRGIHGELLLRASGPGMQLKAVNVGGRDVTDTPYEFKNGDRVTLVMTTRVSSLEGVVTDAAGKPATETAIVVFSEDKDSWRMNATRTRRSMTDPSGKYRLTGLLPGRYFIIAVPRERTIFGPNVDASFFEALTKEATTFVIGEDDHRQLDLKVSTGNEG